MPYGLAVGICVVVLIIIKYFCGRFFPTRVILGRTSTDRTATVPQLLANYSARHVNAIVDQFSSLQQVTQALREAGLESSNVIVGIDFTASNHSQGEKTFNGKCLHAIQADCENPYQMVIRILGETLSSFDEDGIIPAFGFGDALTKDRSVFSINSKGYCSGGFREVLDEYKRVAPAITMSGPTSFAPLIYQAIEIVKSTRQYHILLIVADGQVTSEQSTMRAIVDASAWPLSIVMVGIGDGPWEMMKDYDDKLPARKFDNFQFVDFNRVLCYGNNPETTFALHALMEIPDQFRTIRKLGLLEF